MIPAFTLDLAVPRDVIFRATSHGQIQVWSPGAGHRTLTYSRRRIDLGVHKHGERWLAELLAEAGAALATP